MTDKERLEEIKEEMLLNKKQIQAPRLLEVKPRFFEDITWLIKQAERTQELEEQKLGLIEEMGQVDERFLESEHQNKRYREALEFYAEQDNYEWETSFRPQQEIDCMVIDDGGQTARRALQSD